MYSKQSNYASGFFEVWKEKEDECLKRKRMKRRKRRVSKSEKSERRSSAKRILQK